MIAFIFWTAIAVLLGLRALASVALIGKPRKPIAAQEAALDVVVDGLMIIGIISFGLLR